MERERLSQSDNPRRRLPGRPARRRGFTLLEILTVIGIILLQQDAKASGVTATDQEVQQQLAAQGLLWVARNPWGPWSRAAPFALPGCPTGGCYTKDFTGYAKATTERIAEVAS